MLKFSLNNINIVLSCLQSIYLRYNRNYQLKNFQEILKVVKKVLVCFFVKGNTMLIKDGINIHCLVVSMQGHQINWAFVI